MALRHYFKMSLKCHLGSFLDILFKEILTTRKQKNRKSRQENYLIKISISMI